MQTKKILLLLTAAAAVVGVSSTIDGASTMDGANTLTSVSTIAGVNFLQQYGYLDKESNASLVDQETLKIAVELFQDRHNLTVDGTLNEQTLNYMSKPRCGNTDNPSRFTASGNSKWPNNTVTWYWRGDIRYMRVVSAAFSVWSKHTNLKFAPAYYNPNIIISMGGTTHTKYSDRVTCPTNFDGPGGVLAHAYFPWAGIQQVDIHVDDSEKWQFDMVLPDTEETSFYTVLIHEIGHALGLGHSSQQGAIMFPWYSFPRHLNSTSDIDLHWDDVHGIRFLYGHPPRDSPTTSTTTSTTTTTTTTTTTKRPPPPPPPRRPSKPTNTVVDLCEYKNKISTFVVANKRIYAFHQQHVWVLDLEESGRQPSQLTRPKVITQWLPFLPDTFVNISAVYERPNGEIVLFVDRSVYFMAYPSLRLKAQYSIDEIATFHVEHVNAALNTNKGLTYVIVDNEYVFKLNECTTRGEFLGSINTVFEGVPKNVTGAFRHTNGRLYFITPNSVYEYNEFFGTVTQTVNRVFDVFKIDCFKDHVMNQLYDLINRLTSLRAGS